ncbi:DUF4145 domain-containing protein [Novosphingobium capsulatum]|uniref:DUF4145 domain-containing protein n=1 Tax=Novosphingobium capsulatum TaxID=13688 RepID=UPI000A623BF1|nr:DUF4145 domain-containing protein [Novosphingobium capsulatum]WQD92930.1 DUF4145 domain-containing protein [Novosphingobium capsulatum]
MSFNWSCPHCGHHQSVVTERVHQIDTRISVGSLKNGDVFLCALAIGCANSKCEKLTLSVSIRPKTYKGSYAVADYGTNPSYHRQLIPESFAKPQPDYIPEALREDYREACLILNDSPKAAATLARRCLQGMIRDFCGITKSRLIDEITALRAQIDSGSAPAGVTAETVEAIDHVRTIGNIGAHMEKDINLIVPVDAGEAYTLIQLIEMLFEDWYVARNSRQDRLKKISEIGVGKKQFISDALSQNSLPKPENKM